MIPARAVAGWPKALLARASQREDQGLRLSQLSRICRLKSLGRS